MFAAGAYWPPPWDAQVPEEKCRPLIGALGPLLYAPTRSAVGFGLERLPGRVGHGFTPRGRKRLLVLFISVDRWVPRLHPSSSSLTVHQRMELGAVGHGRPNEYGSMAWDCTLTGLSGHVIFCRAPRSGPG